jgi:hypothetical protein
MTFPILILPRVPILHFTSQKLAFWNRQNLFHSVSEFLGRISVAWRGFHAAQRTLLLIDRQVIFNQSNPANLAWTMKIPPIYQEPFKGFHQWFGRKWNDCLVDLSFWDGKG